MRMDRLAPVTAHREITVAARREVIWDLLTTMDRWAEWNPDVKTATQPQLESGAVFHWKAGPASLTSTLRHVEAPSVIGWTGRSMGVHAVHVWRLESDGERTIAKTEESWSGTLPRLLPGVLRRSLEKTLDSWLRHLKVEAEVRAGG